MVMPLPSVRGGAGKESVMLAQLTCSWHQTRSVDVCNRTGTPADLLRMRMSNAERLKHTYLVAGEHV